jgi:competence transcription factor ComK
MFVGNSGVVSFVVVFCTKHNNKRNNPWVFHKHISSQQNTKTNERTPGFSTNIYHLNKKQNTKKKEKIPGLSKNI